jgi:hypothetical protein
MEGQAVVVALAGHSRHQECLAWIAIFVYLSLQEIHFFSVCKALSPNSTKSNDRHSKAPLNIKQNGKKSKWEAWNFTKGENCQKSIQAWTAWPKAPEPKNLK